MTRGQRRLGGLALVAATAAASWAAAAPALTPDPAVQIVELVENGSGSGSVGLRNATAASITVASIVPEPGCDAAAVHLAPVTNVTIAPGDTRSVAITCTPAPASMQRCGYQVRAPGGGALGEFEAVCAYAGAANLVPDTTAIDFGTVAVGSAATHPVALHNTGAATIDHLFVETTDPAGNFAVAAPCNPDARECDAAIHLVAPGATTALVATCTPRAVGAQSAELHVATSAGTRLTAPIQLVCTGAPASAPVLSVSPGAIDAGAVDVAPATPVTTTVHLSNAGPGTLRLSALQLLDDGTGAAADWTVTAGAPCSAAIPPICLLDDVNARTTDLTVAFTPRALGVRDATLLVNYRDTADRSLSIPLRGTGSGPTLDAIGAPAILDFGALPIGTAGMLTLPIINHGTRNLTDGAINLAPTGPPFSVSPGPTLSVATTAPTPVTITCNPPSTGPFTSKLALSAPDVLGPSLAIALRCAGDAAQTLSARPTAVLLGELRTGTSTTVDVTIGPSAMLGAAELETAIPGFSVRLIPPATVELTAAPVADGALDDRILVTPRTGPALAIPVAGAAVTASYTMPSAVSLGTFCVERPTTPRLLALSSTGTATIGLSAPALQSADSPFDLAVIAPITFPNVLAAHHDALIAVTPRRSSTAGLASDTIVWPTDVASPPTARTTVTATFVANGGAIAPGAIDFGKVPIHVDTHNAQQVTLQNCDPAALRLDPPQVPAPFSIDSASFPTALNPGEIATFSVGFHPTQTSLPLTKKLVITSPQLHDPLTIDLSGEGIATGPDGDAGTTAAGLSSTSFYACGSCTTADPSSALALALAALAVLRPRRRRA